MKGGRGGGGGGGCQIEYPTPHEKYTLKNPSLIGLNALTFMYLVSSSTFIHLLNLIMNG